MPALFSTALPSSIAAFRQARRAISIRSARSLTSCSLARCHTERSCPLRRLPRDRALGAALSAITAAVVGVILNLAIWFALHTLFRRIVRTEAGPLTLELPVVASLDWAAFLLAAAAVVAMFRFRLGPLVTLAGCAAIGLAYRLVAL